MSASQAYGLDRSDDILVNLREREHLFLLASFLSCSYISYPALNS